ncbi:MAG TPA: hypothetical protein VFW77_01390 [Candidatus Saccharimonadales bacterium]|nr:hypothetical protein [Candidatus Saccharimonadales bacterium]
MSEDLDARIDSFLSRKTRQYPELRRFDSLRRQDFTPRRRIDISVEYQS